MKLSIATRQSTLAIWQAEHVAALLRGVIPGAEIELMPTTTVGDRNQKDSIADLGGKGVFATDVQAAVLDGRADFAVHSAKDLRSVPTPGLTIAAVPLRGEARDALIGSTIDELPEGATIGTGSLRRRSALAALRNDLRFVELRGNIETRLRKAEDQGLDAIVLAAVALMRLDLEHRIDQYLSVDQCVPQIGQGALAVEVSESRSDLIELLQQIEDPVSRFCVDVERSYLAALGGDCRMPTGAHAQLVHPDRNGGPGRLTFTAMLASDVGGRVVRDGFELEVHMGDPTTLDSACAEAAQLALDLQASLM